MAQPASAPDFERDHDHVVILQRATWADYQRMLEIRGERPLPRLTYMEGVLEIMTPSKAHEFRKSMIGRLAEAWCMENGVEITPYGSWTLESKDSERGVEPDECYVIGDVPEPNRPDLAIEVIWTSGGLDKLEVYRKLGVREVWIWKRGQIQVHALRAECYEPVMASEVLVGIDLAVLAKFVEVQPMTRAVRLYRAALREESSV